MINAGTNDIAENAGAYNEEYTFGNIVSMVELARASVRDPSAPFSNHCQMNK